MLKSYVSDWVLHRHVLVTMCVSETQAEDNLSCQSLPLLCFSLLFSTVNTWLAGPGAQGFLLSMPPISTSHLTVKTRDYRYSLCKPSLPGFWNLNSSLDLPTQSIPEACFSSFSSMMEVCYASHTVASSSLQAPWITKDWMFGPNPPPIHFVSNFM